MANSVRSGPPSTKGQRSPTTSAAQRRLAISERRVSGRVSQRLRQQDNHSPSAPQSSRAAPYPNTSRNQPSLGHQVSSSNRPAGHNDQEDQPGRSQAGADGADGNDETIPGNGGGRSQHEDDDAGPAPGDGNSGSGHDDRGDESDHDQEDDTMHDDQDNSREEDQDDHMTDDTNCLDEQQGDDRRREQRSALLNSRPSSRLRPAGQNVMDEERLPVGKRPDFTEEHTVMQALMPGHITRDEIPSFKTDPQVDKMAIDSIKSDVSPAISMSDENLFGQSLKHMLSTDGWPRQSNPTIRLVPSGMTTTLFLQFLNSKDASKFAREYAKFTVTVGKSPKAVHYNIVVKAIGQHLPMDIVGVLLKIVEDSRNPATPVPHHVLTRVVMKFADLFGATANDQYPDAFHGILRLDRKQVVNTYSDGAVFRSNHNYCEMALRVPLYEQNQRTIMPYHIDEETGLKFCFTFPGSEKYCTVHADNAYHNDDYCSKKKCNICKAKGGRGGHYDWEHNDAKHLKSGRKNDVDASQQSNVSGGSNSRGRGGKGGRGRRGGRVTY